MNKKLVTILAGVMAAIMVLSLLLGLLATVANGASSGEIRDQINALESEKAALESQIRDLESSLAANNNEIKNMVARKNGLDKQIGLLSSQIVLVNRTIAAQNLMIADAQEELDMAQEKYAMLQQAYATRIRVMEEQGDISYWAVIFGATSFADLLSRLTMVVEIAQADQQQLEQLRQLAQQVEEAKASLEIAKAELLKSKQELQEDQEALFVKKSEAEGLLLALLVKGGQYELELDASEKLQHDLMDEIAHNQKLYDDALLQEWLATSVPPTTTTKPTTAPTTVPTTVPTTAPTTKPTTKPTAPSTTTKPASQFVTNTVNGVTWITPTKNFWISSKFGMRIHPITGIKTMHKGIDMAANMGTPIYATRSGKVTIASYQEGGAGWYVCINHGDGYSSIYMHMTHYIVKGGQYVDAGEIIGYVGTSGGSTGPHLHFGISYNGTYVNPQDYIKT